MNKEEIFDAWAPVTAIWSPWIKPVLFAHFDSVVLGAPQDGPPPDVSWAPTLIEKTALVLDLPGPEGVRCGLALARRGFRPVPLYNAVPLPTTGLAMEPELLKALAAVDVISTMEALAQSATEMSGHDLPDDAPPAFLLDANRTGGGRIMNPEEFDNRSVCFTTDFPSATFLVTHGISRIKLVQRGSCRPHSDLAHILLRWQEAGIEMAVINLDGPEPFTRLEIERPTWYGKMFQRMLVSMGLLRAQGGGFGAWVPHPSSAGG